MNIFLDSSVVLAAAGRPTGASRAIFAFARSNSWNLMISNYVAEEVSHNLPRLGRSADADWNSLRHQTIRVTDVWTIDRPVVFGPAKDRPILFTAAAWADVLLTLDRGDFGPIMRGSFYSLEILIPGEFLERERTAGRLRHP